MSPNSDNVAVFVGSNDAQECQRRSTLQGSRIVLRPVNEDDLPRLLEILREPEVARHWSQPDDDFDQHELLAGDDADNVHAIRAYEKVGFKRVGVMRRYERGADGTFHDGMLLDPLPEDLTDGP